MKTRTAYTNIGVNFEASGDAEYPVRMIVMGDETYQGTIIRSVVDIVEAGTRAACRRFYNKHQSKGA